MEECVYLEIFVLRRVDFTDSFESSSDIKLKIIKTCTVPNVLHEYRDLHPPDDHEIIVISS